MSSGPVHFRTARGTSLPALTTFGCKCPECYGLAEHMLTVTGRDYGLEHAPGHTVLLPDPCEGTLTCDCDRCDEQRAKLVSVPRPRIKQPWDIAA